MTQDNYHTHFDKIEQFYENYDFDADIFFDS